MNSNPLKPIVFVSILNGAYTIYQILVQGVFAPFGIVALVISSIFIFLYFTKPNYAGAFLFYSTIPIYPIYFLTGVLGLNSTPPKVGTYLVMTVIYFVCIFVIWKLKNKYETYLLNMQTNVSEETSL